jgi:hypothetical protein
LALSFLAGWEKDVEIAENVLLLLAAALSPSPAAAQRPRNQSSPSCDPTAPSQLLGKWLLSRQLDCKLQPLRVGVVEDSIGKTVGRARGRRAQWRERDDAGG